MIIRFYLLITIIICIFSNTVHSYETVKVTILPFEVHAQEDLSYLSLDIPKMLDKFLSQEGVVVKKSEILEDFLLKDKAKNSDEIKNFGIKSNVDYVIWGSLNWVGDKYSLDTKIIESSGDNPYDSVFIKGDGIENLTSVLKNCAHKIVMKLLKREKISEILIKGNKRIEADAIKRVITTNSGDMYLVKNLSQDLRAVYSMGYFDDIRVESEDSINGKVVTFKIKEKPTIRKIKISGNSQYDDEEIKETLNLKTGSIFNIFNIYKNIERIKSYYKDNNYHSVIADYSLHRLENNQVDLEFIIKEGTKVKIKKIKFEGNDAYSDKNLKKVMKRTSEKGFFSFITSSGELNGEDLNQDVSRIIAFYQNHGHINIKVGEPVVQYKDNWVYINIQIDEGLQYKVGNVEIEGDLIFKKYELKKKLKITKGKIFNRRVLRNDMLLLTDIYSDEGYAFVNIYPKVDSDDKKQLVNLTIVIEKGKPVYFEKIIITGNYRTRDKVIRRELKVYEQELFGGKRLKRSIRNLYRLDFFDEIQVNTPQGSADDKMILKIDVSEKLTGMFSAGGGYSSTEHVFGTMSITERNLFGKGHILELKGELGGRSSRFTFSFTEPWMFDIPLSAGFDIYNWQRDYDEYDKDSKGFSLRGGYTIFDYTRIYCSYAYDKSDVKNIQSYASSLIRQIEGINSTSSISTSLRYDSRDRVFNPTEGQEHRISIQYAGGPLGGDSAFTKYVTESGVYIPLFKGTVGFLHNKTGYARKNKSGYESLPDYERFYLGGMNSVRGFGWRDIHIKDDDGLSMGGNKFVFFNIEFLVPLLKKAGIVGVVFYDTGNVYGEGDHINLKDMHKSAGFGFRWYSPIGPIRFEKGYILNPEEGEKSVGWEFTMGTAF